jgi:hypothetical protein
MELGNIYRFTTGISNVANTAGVATGTTTVFTPKKTTDVVISECKCIVTTNISSAINVVATLYKNTGSETAIGTCTIPTTGVIGDCFYFTGSGGDVNTLDSTDSIRVGITTAGNTSGAVTVEALIK